MRNIAQIRDECIELLDEALAEPYGGTISDIIWREARTKPWLTARAARLVLATVNDEGRKGRAPAGDPIEALLRKVRARIAASR